MRGILPAFFRHPSAAIPEALLRGVILGVRALRRLTARVIPTKRVSVQEPSGMATTLAPSNRCARYSGCPSLHFLSVGYRSAKPFS